MIEVIGAGVKRIETYSLQKILEILLNAKSYPMFEVGGRPDNIRFGQKAKKGETLNWAAVRAYPVAAFRQEISGASPNVPTIQPNRDPEELSDISSSAIFKVLKEAKNDACKDIAHKAPENGFTAQITTKTGCLDSYRARNQNVKEKAEPDSLMGWH